MNLQKSKNRAIILITPMIYLLICSILIGIIRTKTPTYIIPNWIYISGIIVFIWLIIASILITINDFKNLK